MEGHGRRPQPILVVLLFVLARRALTSPDADVLLTFKATITDASAALATWRPDSEPCVGKVTKWTGVICDGDGSVVGLRLENMNLAGVIDVGPLAALPRLRSFSVMNNGFAGTMPEFGKLTSLKSVYLSTNKFSGVLPDAAFSGMGWLKKLYLSRNQFTGSIPASVAGLPRLLELGLDSNEFSGAIPEFRSKELKMVNLSNNNLEGNIPENIRKMDATLFAGNKGLCGEPLQVSCSSTSPLPSPSSSSSHSSRLVLPLEIGIGLLLVIIVVVGLAMRSRSAKNRDELPTKKNPAKSTKRTKEESMEEGSTHSTTSSTGSNARRKAMKESEQGRLIFVREGMGRFELQDLLKSSAEVLGTGSFVTSYKASLNDGTPMVVKRFRNMNKMGKEDFDEHMRRLGRLSHPNLLPLVAYYYRKDEKLLVTGYVAKRSLADLLHGKEQTTSIDWSTRLKIVKGVARGLNYLYEELQMLLVPHGDLKSTNVLLSDSFVPLLTDFAFVPVMNQSHAAQFMAAFKCPEYRQHEKTSKKSDIWSLGILILEIVTGKLPSAELQKEKGEVDLPSWVRSVDREEWRSEVVDSGMKATAQGQEEMLKLLQIGLDCCEEDAERRCELEETLDRIEALKEEGNGGDLSLIDID
ncbi:pollen receptor-like kinase 1 [Zingiber officinale]|uniref:pollen receptor-like kinase 1 n=1 Tax=Zingiber officinale TaxID=94328 RepID=UPI001C4C6D10|nr:pollen receptor-like kinase 1 [Zingiber officinale]